MSELIRRDPKTGACLECGAGYPGHFVSCSQLISEDSSENAFNDIKDFLGKYYDEAQQECCNRGCYSLSRTIIEAIEKYAQEYAK
jgi:hypothetical protein